MSEEVEVGRGLPRALEEARLLDAEGRAFRLGGEIQGGVAVIVFLRHYGCAACARHVRALLPRIGELSRIEVRVIFIGSGQPAHLAWFLERHRLADHEALLFTDPTLGSFRAAGMVRSFWSAFGPRGVAGQLRAIAEGHGLAAVRGDRLQQGGAIVVDTDGVVRHLYRSRFTGDEPDGSELVRAATKAALTHHRRTHHRLTTL